jgi:hypothetical protein
MTAQDPRNCSVFERFAAVLPNHATEFAGVSIVSFFSTSKAIELAEYAS